MREYIEMLLDDVAQTARAAANLHDEASALPDGEKRDRLAREWALARGEVRGLGIALDRLEEYLYTCQELLTGN